MSEFAAASCTGKVRFESHGAAARVQKRRGKKRDNGKRAQEAYRCKVCQGWHIGRHAEPERSKHAWRRFKQRYEGADA